VSLPEDLRLAGRLVHVSGQPGRRPAVLLLGGCGVPSTLWQSVVELLPDREVVLLDRPGLGGTPWPGRLPTLAEEVDTLDALVHVVGGPVVLVAHSMAGLHAEALARTHPGQVSGLVLVDASVEWDLRRPTALDLHRQDLWLILARMVRHLTKMLPTRSLSRGAARLVVVSQSSLRLRDHIPGLDTLAGPDAVASIVAEQGAYAEQLRNLEQLRGQRIWPALPTVVLTAAGDGGPRWLDDQRRLADLLGGTQVLVEEAQHLMMLDSPSRIAAAVRAVTAREDHS
jgi:pimeloyl-ACP methyl ester carboxylesterase